MSRGGGENLDRGADRDREWTPGVREPFPNSDPNLSRLCRRDRGVPRARGSPRCSPSSASSSPAFSTSRRSNATSAGSCPGVRAREPTTTAVRVDPPGAPGRPGRSGTGRPPGPRRRPRARPRSAPPASGAPRERAPSRLRPRSRPPPRPRRRRAPARSPRSRDGSAARRSGPVASSDGRHVVPVEEREEPDGAALRTPARLRSPNVTSTCWSPVRSLAVGARRGRARVTTGLADAVGRRCRGGRRQSGRRLPGRGSTCGFGVSASNGWASSHSRRATRWSVAASWSRRPASREASVWSPRTPLSVLSTES